MCAAKVDMELKVAFTELHQKMVETTRKVKLMDLQAESLKKAKQKAEITGAVIKGLPENTKLYESIGRFFMVQPASVLISRLEEKSKLCENKRKNVEVEKSLLEKSLKESENNLREMVAHRRDNGGTSNIV
ncbi:prefoldin subunit 1 [Cimex lectularius]|uniref:Prefoldin subunit 1 n=1 Tax=Cimex lectularius TaxID=79782 RepID=A0A8I6SAD6_CIMLE|nr:prefoldin subunit 1 [Cimex lectularius]